jgi:hypothetical protein
MPVIQLEVHYIVQVLIRGSWTDYTEPTASLRFAKKQKQEHIDRFGEENVRLIRERFTRDTIDD